MERMSRFIQSQHRQKALLLVALLVAAFLKGWLVFRSVLPFNSDEAVVALMARHILGGAKPIFFYGQAYMGSLDAWLAAAGFLIFGEQVWVIRLIQGGLYLGVLISTYKLGEVAFDSKQVGLVAVWFLVVPNVIVTLYTTVSLGGYGEGLLIGNLILITGLKITKDLQTKRPVGAWRWLSWGILAGLGLWVIGFTLIYSLPMWFFILFSIWRYVLGPRGSDVAHQSWKSLGYMVLGGILGAVPWWVYGIENGLGQLLGELSGSAVAVETTPWLMRVGQHFVSLGLFGSTAIFGLRPSWEIRWLALPLMPVALTFWSGVLAYIFFRFKKGWNESQGARVLVGMMLVLAAGFVFTSFGVDPSGRYFVPLVIPMALFASEMLISLSVRHGRWVFWMVPLILVFNFWGICQAAQRFPPGITTQFDPIAQVDHRDRDELIQFLRDQGETRGYTNYWVAYPLAFLTQEELIFIPRLPYHEDFRYTPRDDRYEPYGAAVEQSEKVAYITTLHPALDDYLRDAFTRERVTWEERQFGDYRVFYDLSRIIRPEEVGLGQR